MNTTALPPPRWAAPPPLGVSRPAQWQVQGEPFSTVQQAMQRGEVGSACHEFVALLKAGRRPPPALSDALIEGGWTADWCVCCQHIIMLTVGPALHAALCGRGRWAAARDAYAALRTAGVLLKYSTYQQLISAAVKVSVCGWVACQQLPSQLVCCHRVVRVGSPTRAAVQAGDVGHALEVFHDVGDLGLTVNKVTYCSLISACGKQRRRGGRYAQIALELWEELVGTGMQLDAAAYRAGGLDGISRRACSGLAHSCM